MLTNDIGLVARIAKTDGLSGLQALDIEPMRPVRPMLSQNVADASEALDVMGGQAAFETKYDGARIQVHKTGSDIKLFSRKMEDLTEALPDIRAAVKESVHADSVILDCEAIAVDKRTGEVIPFQNVLNRIRRKYKVKELSHQIPMQLRPFDILYLNGVSLVDLPFAERRALLEKTVMPLDGRCKPSEFKILDDPTVVAEFFRQSIDEGHEGLMAKELSADYSPGIRGRKMVKLKETLDKLKVEMPNQKILIFTESKDTLDYLYKRMVSWGISINYIHGQMGLEERVEAESVFKIESQILVATVAAGEGINLQF
jgi:DNA ligase-1